MMQLLTIGMLFTVMRGLVYGAYGYFSGAIGTRLSSTPRFADIMSVPLLTSMDVYGRL
jgi:hypothetical protein